MITARGVTVHLGGRPVLCDVDIDCAEGEVVALVGPNGAGKSTLLGVLAGDSRPDRGSVELAGRPLEAWTSLDLARQRAVVPQRPLVSFPFTVEQVVRMGRAPWRATPAEDRDDEVVEQALRTADVRSLRTRRITQLSGGEAARVALARVLAQDTPVVLLDEPTAALDLNHQEHTMSVARQIAIDGGAVVVVLHDLGLAAAYADRVVVLDRGRLVGNGPPVEVLEPGLLSEVYRHPVDVLADPRSGAPLVVPRRDLAPSTHQHDVPPTTETR